MFIIQNRHTMKKIQIKAQVMITIIKHKVVILTVYEVQTIYLK